MSEIKTGEVIWFNPKPKFGYGFIKWDGEDMFVHFSDVASDGFKTLKKGNIVEFEIGKNNSGSPKAINVKVIKTRDYSKDK